MVKSPAIAANASEIVRFWTRMFISEQDSRIAKRKTRTPVECLLLNAVDILLPPSVYCF